MKEIYINDYLVQYEDGASYGVDYLKYHLDRDEAQVFFDESYHKGNAPFQDASGWNYILTYESRDSVERYILTRSR